MASAFSNVAQLRYQVRPQGDALFCRHLVGLAIDLGVDSDIEVTMPLVLAPEMRISSMLFLGMMAIGSLIGLPRVFQ